jgi:DNA-directed RNA polymerase specialized sigma subunit
MSLEQDLIAKTTTAELADFLDIPIEDFIAIFDEEIAMNYEDIAEWIGYNTGGDNSFDTDDE